MLRLVEADLAKAAGLERVLIVEDEVAVATGIKSLLEIEGIEVAMVHTGGEAIPSIVKFRPDCVILDIGLPDIDGVEIYGQIEGRWPDLPVLISSGHADAAKLDAILHKPTTALLQKPYAFETLRSSLKQLTAAVPQRNLQGR
jgi:CheY-like chemotaxis protein